MAQPSTTYKYELNLTDLDRSVYQSVKQTIARHPSETEERMTVRLLAYALWYSEQLSFGRGLSDVDEPALWEKSLDDRVLHWIEVGQPDAERLTWCSRRTERTSLLAYGSLRVWQNKVVDRRASGSAGNPGQGHAAGHQVGRDDQRRDYFRHRRPWPARSAA
jgi:uncharacterized protein YaeQ